MLRSYFGEHSFGAPMPADVVELLRHHPRWLEKSGCGVGHVEKVPASGSFALCLCLLDGARESIDWKAAMRALRNGGAQLPGEKRKVIRKAFRVAVRVQTFAAKLALGGSACDGNVYRGPSDSRGAWRL